VESGGSSVERDSQLFVSAAFIFTGEHGRILRLRELILKFLGATIDGVGFIKQKTPNSLRLVYHTISRSPLYVVKESDWRKLKEGEE